jgi:hypothetical protein
VDGCTSSKPLNPKMLQPHREEDCVENKLNGDHFSRSGVNWKLLQRGPASTLGGHWKIFFSQGRRFLWKNELNGDPFFSKWGHLEATQWGLPSTLRGHWQIFFFIPISRQFVAFLHVC